MYFLYLCWSILFVLFCIGDEDSSSDSDSDDSSEDDSSSSSDKE